MIMKKIILAFDGTHFSEGAFEFARRLNDLQPVLLTGVFLPQVELANLWSYGHSVGPAFIPLVETSESEIVHQNIRKFEKLCRDNAIDYRVHKDIFNFALPELKNESRFADLVILGSEVFYENMGTKNGPNDFLQDALCDLSCPVILVPEKFDFPESIILAYDGSDSSIYAIKQFAYLFPELSNGKTLLVYASERPGSVLPDETQIEELVGRHYKNLGLYKLDLSPGELFNTWMQDKNSAMLVSGSYGRSGLSRLLKKSVITDVIKAHRLPIFIAHK
jgi:nucleotide-binding universal stress UspA family protein